MGRTIVSDDGCFEWDEEKAMGNWEKHGIHFEKAMVVFFDPQRIEFLIHHIPFLRTGISL